MESNLGLNKNKGKFFCSLCRVSVEYTKKDIENHNKTQQHLNNIKHNKVYEKTKNRFERNYLNNSGRNNDNSGKDDISKKLQQAYDRCSKNQENDVNNDKMTNCSNATNNIINNQFIGNKRENNTNNLYNNNINSHFTNVNASITNKNNYSFQNNTINSQYPFIMNNNNNQLQYNQYNQYYNMNMLNNNLILNQENPNFDYFPYNNQQFNNYNSLNNINNINAVNQNMNIQQYEKESSMNTKTNVNKKITNKVEEDNTKYLDELKKKSKKNKGTSSLFQKMKDSLEKEDNKSESNDNDNEEKEDTFSGDSSVINTDDEDLTPSEREYRVMKKEALRLQQINHLELKDKFDGGLNNNKFSDKENINIIGSIKNGNAKIISLCDRGNSVDDNEEDEEEQEVEEEYVEEDEEHIMTNEKAIEDNFNINKISGEDSKEIDELNKYIEANNHINEIEDSAVIQELKDSDLINNNENTDLADNQDIDVNDLIEINKHLNRNSLIDSVFNNTNLANNKIKTKNSLINSDNNQIKNIDEEFTFKTKQKKNNNMKKLINIEI